jgi:hypothetical protein
VRRLLALLLFWPVAARAAPTGLNQIPTTDLVPYGQLTLQLQNGNTVATGRASVFHEPEVSPQSQVGLPWNIEAGLDVAPSNPPHDYRPLVNVKWTAIREDYDMPAAAIGVTQLGVGFNPNYYFVMSKTLNYDQIQYQKFRAHHRNIKLRGIRLHTGVLYTGTKWRALLGTDIEVTDYFVIYSDWISGDANAYSLGGVLIFNQHDSIQASLLKGNNRDDVSGFIVALTHTLSFDDPFAW